MAKSDLLKEAIADAKAVKETALANAKLALQEAFSGRMKGMLEAQLMNELEGEEETEAGAEVIATGADEIEAGAEDTGMGMPDSVNIGLDFNNDGEYGLPQTYCSILSQIDHFKNTAAWGFRRARG